MEKIKDINYLEISREDLRYNAATVKKYLDCPIIGVLKCDGYGVSIPEAAQAWQDCGVKLFAVSQPQEALALRAAGFQEETLLMSPVADAETLNKLLDAGIILTITGMKTARFYIGHAKGQPIRVHVAVDTGMGRFGIRWSDREQLKAVYSLSGLRVEGIFSHFSASFEKKYNLTQKQLQRFTAATTALAEAGFHVGIRHIANSRAALRFPDTRLDAVRIGSALLGRLGTGLPVSLRPIGVFKAQAVDRRLLLRGETTGYASVCKIKQDTEAIIAAIGFENGFGLVNMPDHFRWLDPALCLYHAVQNYLHRPYVLYKGRRLYLIGRVGSQYSLFDATGVNIQPGEYVTAKARMFFPNQRKKYI